MASWRDLAAKATVKAIEPIAAPPDDSWGLDPRLTDALRSLEHLPPPRVKRPEIWSEVVADALYLAREQWAAKAIALGWSPYDLFGTGARDSTEFDGLAVWLSGRKVAAMTEWKARTICGGVFYREAHGRPTSPRCLPVYLWRFGRR